MRKALLALTIVSVAVAAAVMGIAGITAPKSGATPAYCHSTALSISAPATATAGQTVQIVGGEAAVPQHTVKATLQYRKSTAATWKNGASASLDGSGGYTLNWKAPSVKGKYKVRVRVTHGSASNASAAKTVKVN